MSRIERALSRIETQAALAASRAPGNADLAARHETLRSRVTESLEDLDALIGELER